MSYIVEQKIKGNIYLYQVESYWDKDKKQARQRRVYLGPKEKKTKVPIRKNKDIKIVSKCFGNVFFLEYLSRKLGLMQVLKSYFPEHYNQILALIFYELSEASPLYLFEYWQQEMHLPNIKTLDSEDCSLLCESIGKNEIDRLNFIKQWIANNKNINAVYYDITSISSYSTNIEYIEWGYNRDKENLPQLNMGVLCNQKDGIPLYYNVFPGSIVDVSTLQNNIHFLHAVGLSNILLIMDRGFFSTANVLKMNKIDEKIQFIQPLPLSLKKVKELIQKNKKTVGSAQYAFMYESEILYSMPFEIELGNQLFKGHLFYNEKAELDQKQHFLSVLLQLHNQIENKTFNSEQDAERYIQTTIPAKYQTYFHYDSTSEKIQRNTETINQYFANLGCYLMISNSEQQIDNVQMLTYYRNKDRVEKIFNLSKNETDGNRLRAHNKYTNDGRIFIRFLTLILMSHINQVMREKDLFKSFSMKELLADLRKIKYIKLYDSTPMISEVSKKHKKIFEAFGIPLEDLHSY